MWLRIVLWCCVISSVISDCSIYHNNKCICDDTRCLKKCCERSHWLENHLCVQRPNPNSTLLELSEDFNSSRAIEWCENPTQLAEEDLGSFEGFCVEETYDQITQSLTVVKCPLPSKIFHSTKAPVRKCCSRSEILVNSSCERRDNLDLKPLFNNINFRSNQRLVNSMLKCTKNRHRIRVNMGTFELMEDGSLLWEEEVLVNVDSYCVDLFTKDDDIFGCPCNVTKCLRKCCEEGQSLIRMKCVESNKTLDFPFYNFTDPVDASVEEFFVTYGRQCEFSSFIIRLEGKAYVQSDGTLYGLDMSNEEYKLYNVDEYCVENVLVKDETQERWLLQEKRDNTAKKRPPYTWENKHARMNEHLCDKVCLLLAQTETQSCDNTACIRKCCPLGYAMLNKTCTVSSVDFEPNITFKFNLRFGYECGKGQIKVGPIPDKLYYIDREGQLNLILSNKTIIVKKWYDYCVDYIDSFGYTSAILCEADVPEDEAYTYGKGSYFKMYHATVYILLLQLTSVFCEPAKCRYSIDISDGVHLGTDITKNGITFSQKDYFKLGSSIRGCVCNVKNCVRKCCPGNQSYSISMKKCVDSMTSGIDDHPRLHNIIDVPEKQICTETKAKIKVEGEFQINNESLVWGSLVFGVNDFCVNKVGDEVTVIVCVESRADWKYLSHSVATLLNNFGKTEEQEVDLCSRNTATYDIYNTTTLAKCECNTNICVRKCCQHGFYHHHTEYITDGVSETYCKRNETYAANFSVPIFNMTDMLYNIDTFSIGMLTCNEDSPQRYFKMNESNPDEKYFIQSNGSLYYRKPKRFYPPDRFCVDEEDGLSVYLCYTIDEMNVFYQAGASESYCKKSDSLNFSVPVFNYTRKLYNVSDFSVGMLTCNENSYVRYFKLNNSDPTERYYVQVNGSLYYHRSRKFYPPDRFCVDEDEGLSVYLCYSHVPQRPALPVQAEPFNDTKSYQPQKALTRSCGCEEAKCVRKCCRSGFFLEHKMKTCVQKPFLSDFPVPVYKNHTFLRSLKDIREFSVGAVSCNVAFTLNRTLATDRFYVQENGYLFLPENVFLEKEHFCVNGNTNVVVCLVGKLYGNDTVLEEIAGFKGYGMIISMPFLLLTFLVYLIIPEKNLHRKALMFYVICLLLAYVFLVTSNLSKTSFPDVPCHLIGYFIMFFFLGSFLWMNVMCIDMWLTFRYLFYLYLPMAILIGMNIILFILTAIKIQKVKMETAMLKHNDSRKHNYEGDKQQFNLYLKLLFAMGVNWTTEVISWAALWKMQSVPSWIWYLTDLINALYGIFIFFIFVFKKKIWQSLKKRYYVFIGKPHLAQTMVTSVNTRTSHMSSSEVGEYRMSDMRNGRAEERALRP
nr:unnamed protein product [Callosobruchus chinensis]